MMWQGFITFIAAETLLYKLALPLPLPFLHTTLASKHGYESLLILGLIHKRNEFASVW